MSSPDLVPSTLVSRRSHLVYRELDDGGALFDLDSGTYYELNRTGALIWDLLEAPRRLDDLVAATRAHLAEEPPGVDGEIAAFVGDLAARQLVEVVSPPD